MKTFLGEKKEQETWRETAREMFGLYFKSIGLMVNIFYLTQYKHDFIYFTVLSLSIITPFALFNKSMISHGISYGVKHSLVLYLMSGYGFGQGYGFSLKAQVEAQKYVALFNYLPALLVVLAEIFILKISMTQLQAVLPFFYLIMIFNFASRHIAIFLLNPK